MIPALIASFVLTQVVAPPALVSQYEKAKAQAAERTHLAHICQRGIAVVRRDGRILFIPETQRIRIIGGNHRLTQASHPPTPTQPTESFSYDSVGNRLTSHLTPTPVAVYDNANRLTSNSSFTYTYDANGNLTSKIETVTGSSTTFSYDPENRLVRVNLPGGAFESYRHDALGRRIEINNNGTIRRYIHDGEDIVLELNDTGFPTDKRIHGPGIDEPILITKDQNQDTSFAEDERFYYHADGLGSITKMTNPSAAVVNEYHYDSFGNIISQIETVPQPYKYTGREFDNATGLYFYRERTYNSFTGTFYQEDLANLQGSLNLYSYVSNNPVRWIDPLGLDAGDWWDYLANYRRAQEIAREELQKHPGHNDCDDARRHAEWSRRMAQELGQFYARLFGTGHEVRNLAFGDHGLNEALMDLRNNAEGRRAAREGRPVNPGNLQMVPGLRRR